jgi:hypothetical protein
MATWLIHLQVADALTDDLPGLSVNPLLLGALAPDSGYETPNGGFVPSKSDTHFLTRSGRKRGRSDYHCDEMEFRCRYLEGIDELTERTSFLVGYLTHLMVDNLWGQTIGLATKRRFIEPADDRAEAWELVKADWYDVDALKLLRNPFIRAWLRFLDIPAAHSYIDLIPTQNIRRLMMTIRKRYTFTAVEAQVAMSRQYPYLTASQSNQFVENATEIVAEAVHRCLDAGTSGEATDKHSFLDVTDVRMTRELLWAT